MSGEVAGARQGQADRGKLLDQLSPRTEVVIKRIRLDAIEPDPNQPRQYFDVEELEELAESLKNEGLLQEPAVYPVASDGLSPTRFRLLFGERRWRAAQLAGWTEMACKVIPSTKDEDLVARLKRIDQQDKENSARAALSAVEEAKGLQNKLETLTKLNPAEPKTALVERLAQERGMNATAVFRLLDLLDAPKALRTAILHREITSRDLAFQLSAHWTALLKERSNGTASRRELKFRDSVVAWAEANGKDLSPERVSETYATYAAAHFLDPKMVRTTIKTAEKIAGEVEGEFAKLVQKAIREKWTVKDARRHLSGARGARKGEDDTRRLFEQIATKGKARLTVHLERLDDPAIATPQARAELTEVLGTLLARLTKEPGAAGQAEA